MHVRRGDPGADAAAPGQQALVGEFLQRAAGGRPGDVEPLGHGDLVLDQRARGEFPGEDGRLDGSGDLLVEGRGGLPVHDDLGSVGLVHINPPSTGPICLTVW